MRHPNNKGIVIPPPSSYRAPPECKRCRHIVLNGVIGCTKGRLHLDATICEDYTDTSVSSARRHRF